MTECKTCFLKALGWERWGRWDRMPSFWNSEPQKFVGSGGNLVAAWVQLERFHTWLDAQSHPVCGHLLSSWAWSLAQFPCRSAVAWQVMRSWIGGLAWLVKHLIGRQKD